MNKISFYRLVVSIPLFLLLVACDNKSESKEPNTELGEVKYRVTFSSTWSAETHPDSFPGNPHFSGIVGMTHNLNENLWEVGELASAGMELVAETGGKSTLSSEINQRIEQGDVNQLISEGGIGNSPGSMNFDLIMNPSYSFVSLVSMLAPSPDWIVGVNGLNLMENGNWETSKTIELFVYDAGTDDGAAYTSANMDTDPKQPIARIDSPPFLVSGETKSVGTLVFELQ